MGDRKEEIQELRQQTMRLASALEQHHRWQAEATGVFMFYVDPKTEKIDCCDISGEYGDSEMCSVTITAFNKQEALRARWEKARKDRPHDG